MYEGPNLTLDSKAMYKVFDSPSGIVGLHMRKIGLEILAGAKAMVGIRTGRLRRNITMRQGIRGRVQYVQVTADTTYALMHHEGTRPHEITGGVGRLVRFNVGGKVVYARKVQHPGTNPRKYLTVPMTRAVRR
jgi:hypothetical protein